jgi:plastocyanin
MRRALSIGAGAVALAVASAGAQSTLDRSPNVGEAWVPDGGVVQFNLVHRFYVSPGPAHKLSNFPTLTLATGFGHGVGVGVRYGSNSTVVRDPYRPNELEAFARLRLGAAEGADGLGVAVTPAYNVAARSPDGEVALDWTWRWLTLAGVGRALGKPFGASGARVGLAGSAAIRLTRYVGVSGDVGHLIHDSVGTVWSAGITLAIPSSPHSFSLHASNAASSTIQGNSQPAGHVLYGFEFTIPLHLSRFAPWFHPGKGSGPEVEGVSAALAAPVGAVVAIRNLKFVADTVVITAGQAVRWVNRDPVPHTVTFDLAAETGSEFIAPGHAYAHLFATPGTYSYYCAVHPEMHGVVIVGTVQAPRGG